MSLTLTAIALYPISWAVLSRPIEVRPLHERVGRQDQIPGAGADDRRVVPDRDDDLRTGAGQHLAHGREQSVLGELHG